MHTIIVGNGILGLMTAHSLIQRDDQAQITIIGPADQAGCASLAAAAMFNSFCEVDANTLKNPQERKKFLFNKAATSYWPKLLPQLEKESGQKIPHGFGTYLINNHATDDLEDENFDAIIAALKEFSEPYQNLQPRDIPQYHPASAGRAARAILIPGEGWVNPVALMSGIKNILKNSNRVQFVDAYVQSLTHKNNHIDGVVLEDGKSATQWIAGDAYFLAPGATFSKIIDQSQLALKLPRVFYGVGASILLKTGDSTLSHCIRTPNRGLACGIYAAPQDSSHTLVGASNFISPDPESHARMTSVYTLLKSTMEQIHSDYYRSQIVKINVGWRPTSADTLPLIGKTSIDNLFVATGTKRDGLHCSPLIGELISDLILKKSSPAHSHLENFKPERDLVRVYTREEAIAISLRHTINAAYQHDFKPAKNRMVEDLEKFYTAELNALHDQVGAKSWGIPPEMNNMYKYGHIK